MSGRPPLEFVDTNVLVYAHDRSAGAKQFAARALLARLWRERVGALSVQVLQEFAVNVTAKIARPLPAAEAAAVITALAEWRVFSPQAADVVAALDLRTRAQVSFWDALVIHSANQLGCRVLWTEDLNPGQRFGEVEVRNPFEEGHQRP